MSLRPLTSLLSLLGLAALHACGGAGPDAAGPTHGLDGPDRAVAWDPAEVYAVGGFDGADWAAFGRIAAMDFDSEGFLYVLDDQASTVTQISPEGEFVKTIGGPGQGPGELAQPLSMVVLADDRIAISDIGHRGFVLFDRDGNWIDNVAVDMETEGLPIEELLAHPSGDIVATAGLRMSVSGGGGANRESVSVGGGAEPTGEPIHRFAMGEGREGSDFYFAWDPPPPPEGGESELNAGDGSMSIRMGRTQAFTPDIDLGLLPDGLLVVADSTSYRIKLVDTETGEEVATLERPIPPTRVDDGIRDRERDRRIAEAEESRGGGLRVLGGSGGMSIDQGAMQRMMMDQIENMAFYPEIPVVEEIAVDSEGRIWVQRSSGVPGEDGPTDLITADGAYIGTLPADGLRIPEAFGPGGLIAVMETDELDVPTVRVLRVPVG